MLAGLKQPLFQKKCITETDLQDAAKSGRKIVAKKGTMITANARDFDRGNKVIEWID